MKRTLLVSGLLISLMLIVVPIGYAGNPPPPLPPEEQYGNYVGPDITGTLVFERLPGVVNVTFKGSCRSSVFTIQTSSEIDFFNCISPEWLLGTCTAPPLPAGCDIYCKGLPEQLFFPELALDCDSTKNDCLSDCYPKNPQGKEDFNNYPVVYKVVHFTYDGTNVKTAKIVGKWLTIIFTK